MSNRTQHTLIREGASPSGLRRWRRSWFSCVARAVVTAGVLLVAGGCGGDDGPTGPGVTEEPEDTTPDAVPRTGEDQDVARGESITLSGAESSDPDGDPLAYTWTQIWGPDVTDGDETLSGENVTVDAPAMVSTLVFTLEVDDGNGTGGVADTVQINVLEHTDGAIWVDGDGGSDTDGTGTRNDPYATLSGALDHVDGPNQDIYVKTRAGGAAYEESSTLRVPTSISLYGGYDESWRRDAAGNGTVVHGATTVMDVGPVEENAWVSGFSIVGADATGEREDAFGIHVVGGSGTITVEDNHVRSGSAGNGSAVGDPGSSYGVWVVGGEVARVRRNVIESGAGGNGADGRAGSEGGAAQGEGSDGSNPGAGIGGEGSSSAISGGDGGGGGTGFSENGGGGRIGQGSNGGAGGSGGSSASGGGHGSGGGGGDGGAGGFPGVGHGALTGDGFFLPDDGLSGVEGKAGSGGGGGGGGASSPTGLNAGGGGGGGGGGVYGEGGRGGGGGGASVGLLIDEVVDAQVEDNEIVAGAGGVGADGGTGGIGGNGSKGGDGGPRKCGVFGCDAGASGAGGHGAGGGKGGQGGWGGGGAGGPSYGILVGAGIAPTIRGNTVTSGAGGAGGGGGGGGFKGSDGQHGSTATRLGGSVTEEPRADSKPGGGGGFSYAVFDLDADDGFAPVLEDNSLTPGTGGEGGTGVDQARKGAVGESGPTNS